MAASLGTIITKAIEIGTKPIFKNGLKSLGVGLITYTVVLTLYNTALAYLHASFGDLGSFFYAFNIAGIDVFVSKCTSALGIRIYIVSNKISFRSLS